MRLFKFDTFFGIFDRFSREIDSAMSDLSKGVELAGNKFSVQVVGNKVEITGRLEELRVNGKLVRFVKPSRPDRRAG